MLLPNRHESSSSYRYGFQGQEKDDEIREGEGNSINYTFRMHDPRIGRFFAVDPLTKSYPHYTPYSFSGNKVISHKELEGLEELIVINDNPHCNDLFNSFFQVVQKDDVLNETLLNGISKPELAEKYKVFLGEFTFENDKGGQTYDNRTIRGMVLAVKLFNENKENYDGQQTDNINYTIKILEALGITSEDYKGILNDKNTKRFGVLVNSNDKSSELDKMKTIAHEIDFHLKNDINYILTKDKKYKKRAEEEHIENFGDEWYEQTGNSPRVSPPKEETPPKSKAGILFKFIEDAYRKWKKS